GGEMFLGGVMSPGAALSGPVPPAGLAEEGLAKDRIKSSSAGHCRRREPHRCPTLGSFGATRQLVDLDARRAGRGRRLHSGQPNDSDGGMQGTLASVCTLAVIRDGAELRPRFLAEH